MHPDPAAVTACLYILSWASPVAKTPGTLVSVLPGFVKIYPASSSFKYSLKISVLGWCPIAIKTPPNDMFLISLVTLFIISIPSTDSSPLISLISEFQWI